MRKNIEIIAISITLIVSTILGVISIKLLGEYGWMIFVFIPFLIGFMPPFITSRAQEITRKKSYSLGFITLGLACLCLLMFAIEGLICIIMASPILGVLTFLGSYLAFLSQGKKVLNETNLLIILTISAIGLMSFDGLNEPKGFISVKTKIVVNANIDTVWNNVVTFSEIDQPTDWIFSTGIAYPTDATIDGVGVGAIRYCNFSTGSFVEPITTWDEPNLLAFDVKEQPVPMNELNPFWEVHPPHLEGYFVSYKGQFKLTDLANNKTELEGTTWYQINITPEFYWKYWSDFIIHRIHKRVLIHIQNESEKD